MNKHTPGPWVVGGEQWDDDEDMATIPIHPPHNKVQRVAEAWLLDSDEEQMLANARLIAAAPDLLAALERIADACYHVEKNGYAHGEGWVAAHAKLGAYARAALARARSEA